MLYEQDVELQSQRGRLTQLHANCQQGESAFAITARTQGTLSEHSAGSRPLGARVGRPTSSTLSPEGRARMRSRLHWHPRRGERAPTLPFVRLGFRSVVLGSDSGAAEHLASVIAREARLLERAQARAGAAVPEQPSVVPVDVDRPLAIAIMADDPPPV